MYFKKFLILLNAWLRQVFVLLLVQTLTLTDPKPRPVGQVFVLLSVSDPGGLQSSIGVAVVKVRASPSLCT